MSCKQIQIPRPPMWISKVLKMSWFCCFPTTCFTSHNLKELPDKKKKKKGLLTRYKEQTGWQKCEIILTKADLSLLRRNGFVMSRLGRVFLCASYYLDRRSYITWVVLFPLSVPFWLRPRHGSVTWWPSSSGSLPPSRSHTSLWSH